MGWNLLLHWNFGFQVSFFAKAPESPENLTKEDFSATIPDVTKM